MFLFFVISSLYFGLLYAIYNDKIRYFITRDPFDNPAYTPMHMMSDEEESEDDEFENEYKNYIININNNNEKRELDKVDEKNENSDTDEGSYEEPNEEEYKQDLLKQQQELLKIDMKENENLNGSASEESDDDDSNIIEQPLIKTSTPNKFKRLFSSFLSTQSTHSEITRAEIEMNNFSHECTEDENYTLVHIRDTKSY